jgi:hypothetical protein
VVLLLSLLAPPGRLKIVHDLGQKELAQAAAESWCGFPLLGTSVVGRHKL